MAKKQDDDKLAAALKAVEEMRPGIKVGLGTGSTVSYFIEALGKEGLDVPVVCSSRDSEQKATKAGLKIMELNKAISDSNRPMLDVYVDGADEIDPLYNMIKGGGGALTREKIVAAASLEFICIVDGSKIVKQLGKFPLPIEVLEFAEVYVTNELTELGGQVVKRKGFKTDEGNIILDVTGLDFSDPLQLETELNNIPGVVENGIFSVRNADKVIVGKNGKAEYI
ncbi:MAG TPA: ribose-5-phosphate isomerase RpiA [Candidatus Altiarchaeales archaeon]|nr:ribose-5-phosphate isomerase RpiA [Candidatus Altiarchaeales archaeon]